MARQRKRFQFAQVGDAKTVSRALEEIATLLTLSGGQRFKAQAYAHGASVVAQLAGQLGAAVEDKRLAALEGIGPALEKQITELWQHGESELLRHMRSQHSPGAAELAQIGGMTARRIRTLYEELSITSAEQLREACMTQRVRGIKGFGEKLEHKLLIATEHWLTKETSEPQILLADAYKIAARFATALVRDATTRVELAGAARRGEEIIREVELVIEGEREQVLGKLPEVKGVVRIDAQAGLAHVAEGVAVRFNLTVSERSAATLLFATGNDPHVSALRQRAHARGFELTPDGLLRGGIPLPTADEAALYGALGLAWVPPELRTGGNELALAEHEDFADLLSSEDVCGMVHCHTHYSDGKNSIEEMARGAEALGMDYITITDHSPSARYAGGVDLERLKQQWDEIARVQERVRVRILRGTEADILADGALDYPDSILEQFDVIIASVHARFRLGKDAVTQRLVRALSVPIFKVWGHPLGRILMHRDPVDCDLPTVLDALAASRGAIELNGDPHRLDLPPVWIPLARERGIPFVVSSDAHSVRGLDAFRHGVTLARRGGLRRHEVLNTLSPEQFAARVRPVPSEQR